MENRTSLYELRILQFFVFILYMSGIFIFFRLVGASAFEFFYERGDCFSLSEKAVDACLKLNQINSLSNASHSAFGLVLFVCGLSFSQLCKNNIDFFKDLKELIKENKGGHINYQTAIFFSLFSFVGGFLSLYILHDSESLFRWYTEDLIRLSTVVIIANILAILYKKNQIESHEEKE